jgi:antitoxin component of RelBE/YafQ-DinJ toxin-antitoxin module
MDTTTLQVPISKTLKSNATEVAKEYGFSSLQEIVRVMLSKLAKKEFVITFGEQFPTVALSAKNEARYAKMEEDFKANRNVYTADNLDDFFNKLKE